MRTLKIAIIGLFLLVANATQAQVSVNINVGTPPSWGPAGYSNMDYYYLPDIRSYYDVRASQFIYFGGNRWIRSNRLPRQYRNYDLHRGRTVVLNDYHGRTPYLYYNNHKVHSPNRYRVAQERSYRDRDHGGKKHYDRHDNRKHDKHDRHDNERHNGRH